MRRLSAAVTCLALVPVLGGLVACSGPDGTPPAATTGTVARQAGGAEAVPGGLGPGKLATFLLEGVLQGVGAQGYTFLSDLLFGSDDVQSAATTQQLTDINNQLDEIDTRLDTITTDLQGISGQIADGALNSKLDTMNTWHNTMKSLYREKFVPIAAAAKDVSTAKQALATGSPTPTLTQNLVKANKALQDAKTAFSSAFDNAQPTPYSLLADQHDALYPNAAGFDSALKLAGKSLQSKGFTTWTDSQRLQNLYLSLSDDEALTALLILEHDKMFGASADTQQRHTNDYVTNHNVEVANLPPEIPWGQIKVGDQMWVTAYDSPNPFGPYFSGAWLPISPEGKQLGTWSPQSFLPDFPGWSLPTDRQLTGLYDGTKNVPAAAGSTHLGSIWKNTGHEYESFQGSNWGQSWYWTKDTSQSNPMSCDPYQDGAVSRVYTLHHVGNMTGASAIELQGQPGRIPDFDPDGTTVAADCDNILVKMYNNDTYSASVVLTRTVDPDKEDFMAQRSTALSPPATPTTTS